MNDEATMQAVCDMVDVSDGLSWQDATNAILDLLVWNYARIPNDDKRARAAYGLLFREALWAEVHWPGP